VTMQNEQREGQACAVRPTAADENELRRVDHIGVASVMLAGSRACIFSRPGAPPAHGALNF
jgi:hypothetical protein